MGSPMKANPVAAPPVQPDPSAAQRAAFQAAETSKKLREARGRRSMFLTYDDPTPAHGRQAGRQNGASPLLGG